MKFIYLLVIFLTLNSFSCHSSSNKEKTRTESSLEINDEGYAVIRGRVCVGGSYPDDIWIFIDDGRGKYLVYHPEIEEYLRNFFAYIIEFNVIIHDDQQMLLKYPGMTAIVVPISWEIINGPPERTPPYLLPRDPNIPLREDELYDGEKIEWQFILEKIGD